MKAKFSPLEIHGFELTQFNYKFIVPKDVQSVDTTELFKSYPVGIDFNHSDISDSQFQVFCKIDVNKGKKAAGYSIFAEGMGVFELEDLENLEKSTGQNLKYFSSLNMMINNLRNTIFQNTNLGPMGAYLLPPVDVLDLFAKKQAFKKKGKKS